MHAGELERQLCCSQTNAQVPQFKPRSGSCSSSAPSAERQDGRGRRALGCVDERSSFHRGSSSGSFPSSGSVTLAAARRHASRSRTSVSGSVSICIRRRHGDGRPSASTQKGWSDASCLCISSQWRAVVEYLYRHMQQTSRHRTSWRSGRDGRTTKIKPATFSPTRNRNSLLFWLFCGWKIKEFKHQDDLVSLLVSFSFNL